MKNNKLFYKSPVIELVALDHEISLALSSAPPEGPGEDIGQAPAYFHQNDALLS
jgi:hypothetical protein